MSVVLPIETNDRFEKYTASAGQTVFPVPFPFQDNADVAALLQDPVSGDYTELSSTLYTLTGAGNPSGGSLAFAAGRTEGDVILMLGRAVLERLSSVVRDGAFSSKLIDGELDRNRIIQQEQARDIARAVKTDYGAAPQTLPPPSPGNYLGWSADGKLVSKPSEATSAAAAEASAAAAAASAASISMPAAPAAGDFLRRNAGNTAYEALTASELVTAINVKALNADGGFSFDTTATTQDIGGAFGGVFKAGHRIFSSDDATFAGSRATKAIMRTAAGSGANGPSRADYSLHIETLKKDWLTSPILGEVDGIMLNVRQNSEGDSGGILINHSKVASASYGAVGIEQTLAWVQATTGTVLRNIHSTMGSHLPSTDIRRDGVGFSTRADAGSCRTGFLAYDNGGNWMYAFLAASSIAAGSDYFHVTGPGNPDGSGRLRVGDGSGAAPSLAFVSHAGLGFYLNGTNVIGVSAAGAAININFGPAGMRIGSGLVDPGAGKLNVLNAIQVNNSDVVRSRKTGWGRASGTFTRTTFATGSITLPQLAERVAALIEDFHADSGHGLIGS